MSTKKMLSHLSGTVLEQQTELTLDEVGRACAVQAGFIMELIEEGVIAPLAGSEPQSWRFTSLQVRHVKVAWRLQRDLGVNLPGAALALQLLDEVETLRAQITAAAQAVTAT
nr:chaperone modulator CbpM [Rhodoferax sp.]